MNEFFIGISEHPWQALGVLAILGVAAHGAYIGLRFCWALLRGTIDFIRGIRRHFKFRKTIPIEGQVWVSAEYTIQIDKVFGAKAEEGVQVVAKHDNAPGAAAYSLSKKEWDLTVAMGLMYPLEKDETD